MDDLSGLDWSSKPAASQPKPPLTNLAYPSFRPSPSPLGSGRSTPLSTQGSTGSLPKPAQPNTAQDSFSNLLNFGLPKAAQNLTLAERQAQLEAEKRKKEQDKNKLSEAQFGNGQHWDTLGSRGFTPSPALQPPAAAIGTSNDDDDDLFAAFNRDTKVDNASHYPPPEPDTNKTDLSNLMAWASTTDSNGGGGGFGAEDNDDPFGLSGMKPNGSAGTGQGVANAAENDDFLGDLARPVDEVRREQQAKQQASQQASHFEPGKPIEDDSSSSEDDEPMERNLERVPRVSKDPFDKAVAQLVDYGFTPEQARRGLVESGTGFNAQAAANWLLDEAHRKSKAASQGRDSPAAGSQARRNDSRSPARGEADLAKSAAAMGSSLFKSANSLWKTGQKKVQQAVAELQQDGDPSQPRWMRDAQQARMQPRPQTTSSEVTDEALMLDSGDRPQPARNNHRQPVEPRPAPRASRGPSPAQSSGTQSRNSPVPRWQQQQPAPPPVVPDARSRLNRLAVDDDDSFSSYVSASRRKKASPAPEPRRSDPEPDLLFNSEAPKSSQPAPQRPPQRQTPAPIRRPQATPAPPRHVTPKPTRQIPPMAPQALQVSTTHRLQGTAHFKRGDYAAAHSSYTSSLSPVPRTHPLTILLLTNRALTALKTGEPKQAVSDADEALKLIGPGNGHGETVIVKNENGQDENRDMKDLYGKALCRKAEALEQMEKWAEAGTVWQQCVEGGVGGATAVKGRQRCQNALAPKPQPQPVPRPAAKPRPQPSATASFAPQKSSEAVTRLREANEAAAKEDDEKFALADKVDGRVSAWRDGKRENLRALLASLDHVLWENSGWKKVGLHELVMANKVKISYMKAIAKTHPDKLPQDASTEVRLIAGLVFSTLNESWDKFKADNGL